MDIDTLSWPWLRLVVFVSLFIGVGSSPILLLLARAMPFLGRLPTWLRWVMMLPAAVVADLIGESVYRLLLAAIEIGVNHRLLVEPGVDEVIVQLLAPLWFVAFGLEMAPTHKALAFTIVGGFKVTVAAVNLVTIARFVIQGGAWQALDPDLQSPLWWNAIINLSCLTMLVALGVSLVRGSRLTPIPLPRPVVEPPSGSLFKRHGSQNALENDRE